MSVEEVLAGYDEVSEIYPFVPPMTMWRAWEVAVYKHYSLKGRVLDIGCGDGLFFKSMWPGVKSVSGIDADVGVASQAESSGVYDDVHVAFAHELPFLAETFDSAFANCALEHFDHLDLVLAEIYRCLRPGGEFVFSVVTDKFVEWMSLPALLSQMGMADVSLTIKKEYEKYHHLVNPNPADEWIRDVEAAGFNVLEHWPIVPELTSKAFLFADQLWHIKHNDQDIGVSIEQYFSRLNNFPERFRNILAELINLDMDSNIGSGAVFRVKK